MLVADHQPNSARRVEVSLAARGFRECWGVMRNIKQDDCFLSWYIFNVIANVRYYCASKNNDIYHESDSARLFIEN